MRSDTKIKGQEALTMYLPTVQAMTNCTPDAINAVIKEKGLEKQVMMASV